LVCGEKSVKLQGQGTKSGQLDKKVYQFPEIGQEQPDKPIQTGG
jgi:hypothetical protein